MIKSAVKSTLESYFKRISDENIPKYTIIYGVKRCRSKRMRIVYRNTAVISNHFAILTFTNNPKMGKVNVKAPRIEVRPSPN